MNIIDWSKTAKQVTAEEDHEARWFGFDIIIEHADNSWIGVVDQQVDANATYWVMAGNYDDYFEKLSDAQVALWNNWAKSSHEEVL